MATASKCVKQHCSDCLGIKKGQRAFDCKGPSCPLYRCSPFRGKLLPVMQRPGDYNEEAEVATLALLREQHPKRQPSGSLCTAMCRECMGVRITPGMPDEQKGGGAREDCGKGDCALHPWQPYQPGGRQRRERSGATPDSAQTRVPVQSDCPNGGPGLRAGVEAQGQVTLAL